MHRGSRLTPRSTGLNSQCRIHPSIVSLTRLLPAYGWLLGRLTAFVRPLRIVYGTPISLSYPHASSRRSWSPGDFGICR